MKVLIADDDKISRLAAGGMLRNMGHEAVQVEDGTQALAALTAPDAPRLAILDWKMPGTTGIDIVKAIRARTPEGSPTPPYLILVTVLRDKKSVVEGLAAGADDYVTKPYDADELRWRISNGARMVALQEAVATRIRQLEEAMSRVKTLQGFLVVCSACKKARVSHDYWQALDGYMASHSDIEISHGYCPECFESEMAKIRKAGLYRKDAGGEKGSS